MRAGCLREWCHDCDKINKLLKFLSTFTWQPKSQIDNVCKYVRASLLRMCKMSHRKIDDLWGAANNFYGPMALHAPIATTTAVIIRYYYCCSYIIISVTEGAATFCTIARRSHTSCYTQSVHKQCVNQKCIFWFLCKRIVILLFTLATDTRPSIEIGPMSAAYSPCKTRRASLSSPSFLCSIHIRCTICSGLARDHCRAHSHSIEM